MDLQRMKESIFEAIELNRNEIINIGRTVLMNPEMGYREFKTASLVKGIISGLTRDFTDSLAVTGVKAVLRGRSSRFKIAVLGELDAVLCPSHPYADKTTGAAHACGHNAQIASMLGTAIGLAKSGIMESLDGDVVFMAVPAEEFVELEYRQRLKDEGRISFLGGKQELIRIGAFDDIDMAMMVHCHSDTPGRKVFIYGTSTGFIGKSICFKGREAHAGGAPHEGLNALNAAMAALMCIHAQRETFRDEDQIRVHPIITKGGDLVNIVPADVRMETYVRGKTLQAVIEANKKVNRAIMGGAYAIGAEAEITEIPGYLPLNQDHTLSTLFENNIKPLVGKENITEGVDLPGSTDAGDLSSLIPVIHPTMGGFKGPVHSRHFEIADEDAAYILPAKAMAATIVDLLENGAGKAERIKREFSPQFTKDSYLKMWKQIINTGGNTHVE